MWRYKKKHFAVNKQNLKLFFHQLIIYIHSGLGYHSISQRVVADVWRTSRYLISIDYVAMKKGYGVLEPETPNDPQAKTSLMMCAWTSQRCISWKYSYYYKVIWFDFVIINKVFQVAMWEGFAKLFTLPWYENRKTCFWISVEDHYEGRNAFLSFLTVFV